ncbi:unnamed protein product [Toxocara canis]|uniref:Secreted protein n=1 Tax=Toxocara canis TaxID=6265 RepID=A0A183UFN5_TOXCA|nr:unnamed protein product [Toxocara canis]
MLVYLVLMTSCMMVVIGRPRPKEDVPVVIRNCTVVINGVTRPSVAPSSCKNYFSDSDCASVFAISADIQRENAIETNNYKVNGMCYSPVGDVIGIRCRSMCGLCCEPPPGKKSI